MKRSLVVALIVLTLPAFAGAAAASGTPGSQVAVAPGTALEFRLAKPVSVDVVL